MMHTIVFPAFSSLWATAMAACTAAPDEMPTSRPSFWASSRAMTIASSLDTWTTSSIRAVSQLPGMNPAPMPWILCGPGAPPLSTGDSTGSTAMDLRSGFLVRRNCVQPVMVPPVPTPPMKISMLPSVWSQISGPVVSRWILGLSGLLNCCRIKAFSPSSSAICSAFLTAPPIPLAAGVSTTLAPKALSKILLSMDMLSGMVRIRS
mmetsp:Transcript_22974/g.31838  ORF Transcript_22974/g.31838 Transcript_22974/m.31838 type:complete len:206 (+) Transcript_22974:186-803(+)